MKLLLDTHLLLWAAEESKKLPSAARRLLSDAKNELIFSSASLWEIAIKRSRNRADFQVDPRQFRRSLLDNDYRELDVTGDHAVAVDDLPLLHRDPFDRLLVAQATVEGILLLTSDQTLEGYGRWVRLV